MYLKTACTVLGVLAVLMATPPGVAAQTLITYDPAAGEKPVSVAVDKVGNVWVSLQGICELRRYTPDWQESARIPVLGDCTDGAGASGLAVDATGAVYVGVKGPEAVRGVYPLRGSAILDRIPGTEQILFPNSIAFDHNNGTMYVTDMTGGAVYRVSRGGTAELWVQGPALSGIPIPGLGLPGGANGIAVHDGCVIVSVTFLPRIVRIPVNTDGSAGEPEVLYDFPSFMALGLFAVDDIALDVFGNIYASVIAAPTVAVLAADGSGITTFGLLPAAVTSLAFGTGKGYRKSLFVALNPDFGGSVSALVELDAGVPGRPLP